VNSLTPWLLIPAFLLGAVAGATAAGVSVGWLFGAIVRGLGQELLDDVERRFVIQQINREYAAEAFARPADPETSDSEVSST
jgi:hypothetical protein